MQTGHENIEKANGQYIKTVKYYQIQDDKYHLQFIDENTIGQYTGLKDKNGKEIYEGDILEYANKYKFLACFGEHNINPEHCAEAMIVGFYLKSIEQKTIEQLYSIDGIAARFPKHCAESEKGIEKFMLEVIGNKWDNPELLEKGE